MPSLESGRSIDDYFGNKIRFEDYVKQFDYLCDGYSDEFIAEYLGVHKLTVRNLLECKHVSRVETYERLEKLLEIKINMRAILKFDEFESDSNESKKDKWIAGAISKKGEGIS